MFDCYQRSASGMTLSDPTGTITIRQWLEALVDDTSLFTNQDDADINNLVRTLEKDAQEWERFLSASGGCLELSKCFYYVLSWTFNSKGDASPMTIDEVHSLTNLIHLQEYNMTTPTPIASKPPEEAHKTLGVWKSMDGNVSKQIEVLDERSKNLSSIVATSGLYPYQADVTLRMIYTPAMCYSLPAVSIPEKALNKIQFKALENLTPALGYNRGFPQAVLLGPTEYGGVGIPHLYTEMNLDKLENIIMHIRSNSTIGKIFQINLNWFQMNAGISTPLLEYPEAITYCQNWFTHNHEFILKIDARIVIKGIYTPRLEREFDSFIMDKVLKCSVRLSKNQERHVNNWRLYFRVQKLSDITNAVGDNILPMYFKFPTSEIQHPRCSKLKWLYQQRPTCKVSFKLCAKCLRICYLHGHRNTMVKPLGRWLVSPQHSESIWSTYIDNTYTSLIQRNADSILCYSTILRTTSCTTTFDSSISEPLDFIPDQFFPVTVTIHANSIVASHMKQRMCLSSPSTDMIKHDIIETIRVSPPWKRQLLQHFHIYDHEDFIHILKDPDQKMFVVADGGLNTGKGSFGVAMGTFGNDLCSIERPAPGNSILLTSLRSEAYGALAALAFLNLYISTYDIDIPKERSIHFYSDNLGLVRWLAEILENGCYPRMYIRPEADVVIQIKNEVQQAHNANFRIHGEHVKGHQDDILPFTTNCPDKVS